jgi:hypothetical protein
MAALDDFGSSVRYWSPTVFEYVLVQSVDAIIVNYPVLVLGAWLVTSSPPEHSHRSELHQALKQTVAILQSRS